MLAVVEREVDAALVEADAAVVLAGRPGCSGWPGCTVDIAPVRFLLRMFQRIPVTFRCRRHQIFRTVLASHIESVKCAQRSDLECRDSVQGIVTGLAGLAK